MSSPGAVQSAPTRRQKRMGPAPFASFEDLSDEVRSHHESPEDKNAGSVVRLPGIREDATPCTPAQQQQQQEELTPEFVYTGISLVGAPSTPPSTAMSSISTPQSSARASLQTPSTPRIDISRASSSSHHDDSRDSTPERELFEGHDPARAKLGLGFREEGTLDLRSSTEELDFQDQTKPKQKTRSQSPNVHDESYYSHHRKDSQSSEIGLLSISGRTSRLSSIGSQGSAHSRMSNASYLSVISGQSGLSRSPSPHKMLLETSFCGTKPNESAQKTSEKEGTKTEPEDLEKVLLSRQHDPTKAILAEGISVDVKTDSPKVTPPEKTTTKKENLQSVKSNITITVEKPPVSSNNTPKLPRTIIAPSGIEYTYIPLKGPLPHDFPTETPKTKPTKDVLVTHSKTAPTNSKSHSKSTQPKTKERNIPKPAPLKGDEPKYIRIKLKPDYMYDPDDRESCELHKPDCLDLNDMNKKPLQSFSEVIQKETKPEQISTRSTESQERSISSTPSASPKLPRQTVLREPLGSSKSPSPSLSRKNSFASLFRSKETIISPESPTIPGCKRKSTLTGILKDASENLRERRRSRSKSRERERSSLSVAPSSTESIDSKGKSKAIFSIFKGKKHEKPKSEVDSSSSEVLSNLEGLANVEFKFNAENSVPSKGRKSRPNKTNYEVPLEGESIRIPLHSPTFYEQRSILQELKSSSQGSQETVIEASTYNKDADAVSKDSESVITVQSVKTEHANRQSSTSSENVIFSTKIGSNNDIFTTKLPKDKNLEKPVNQIENKIELGGDARKLVIPENSNLVEKDSSVTSCLISNGTKTPEIEFPVTTSAESLHKVTAATSPVVAEDKMNHLKEAKEDTKRNSVISSVNEEEHYSSESEKDSELDFLKEKQKLEEKPMDTLEPERKGLVLQQDSFEDELPYIPTTLPLERSVALPIIPIKQRSTYEMKTCPIERPRSTTPINPSCLEDYCEEVLGSINTETITKTIEKLKISLPREESFDRPSKLKSPRRTGNTNWFEFAEKQIVKTQRRPGSTQETELSPPPLPPKGLQKEWINFEEIPERRKPPKRIQTIPSRGTIEVPEAILQENVVYSYVNPEDCKCECHEINARERERQSQRQEVAEPVQEDELPLLEEDNVEEEKNVGGSVETIKLDVTILDRTSVISDSSVDLSTSVDHVEAANSVECLQTPFTSDLGVSSNRSSIISQDEPQSPDGSPNAFPKTS